MARVKLSDSAVEAARERLAIRRGEKVTLADLRARQEALRLQRARLFKKRSAGPSERI